jgi:hypothetical protein
MSRDQELRCRECHQTAAETRTPVSPQAVAFTCSRCLMRPVRVPGNPDSGLSHGSVTPPSCKPSESRKIPRGFSGTSRRGGRPALPPAERRRRARNKKRRQRATGRAVEIVASV